MAEKLFYDNESERLWTLSEIKKFYEAETEHDLIYSYGFETWLKYCMTENNGVFTEVKKLYTIGNCDVWNIKTDLY